MSDAPKTPRASVERAVVYDQLCAKIRDKYHVQVQVTILEYSIVATTCVPMINIVHFSHVFIEICHL